jgi:hypothetical protein
MKIIFYGSRGSTHIKSKLHKKLVGTIVICNKTKIYIDCGFNKRISENSIIIITKPISIKSSYDLPYSQMYTTKSIANEIGLKHVNILTCGQYIKLLGIEILPIRTIYRIGHETIGVQIGNVFIAHWVKKVPNFKYWLPYVKYYIGDGSRWKSIVRQIKNISKRAGGIRCYFTNCGSDIICNHKYYSELMDLHKIVHDGFELRI